MKQNFKSQISLSAVLIIATISVSALADTIVLKDGRVLQGTFKGGTASVLQFEVNGKIQDLAIGEITSLTFSPHAQQPAAAQTQTTAATAAGAATATSTAAPQTAGTGTVPAGTKLMLKTKDAISTASHQKGAKFTAILETDLAVAGKMVVPKGTLVYGTVLESSGGKRVGVQRLVVTFTDLSINNQMVPIVTDDVGAEGGRGGAAKTVGAGALIGAAAGDAAAGAAVGGALALLGGGGQIQIPANTLVEVSLKQAVTLTK
jgi:hypothetical protein